MTVQVEAKVDLEDGDIKLPKVRSPKRKWVTVAEGEAGTWCEGGV